MKITIKNILKKLLAIFKGFLFTYQKWVTLTINFVKKIIINIEILILLKNGLIDFIFIILELFNSEWFILTNNKKKKKTKKKTKEINSNSELLAETELGPIGSSSKSSEQQAEKEKTENPKKTENSKKTENEENDNSNTETSDYNNLLEKLKQDKEWDESNYNLQLTKTQVWLQQGDSKDIDLWKKKQEYLEGQYLDVENRTIDSRAVAYWGAKECELQIKKLISEGKQPETDSNDNNNNNNTNDLNINDDTDNNDWGGGDWD